MEEARDNVLPVLHNGNAAPPSTEFGADRTFGGDRGQDCPMIKLHRDVQERGIASKAALLWLGHDLEHIRMCVGYGSLVLVRKGWYALPGENEQVVRAWRVGGRLACVSAIAFHEGREPTGELHVEVPGNTARLRSPSDRRVPLDRDDDVVIHWARLRSDGDSRAVDRAAAARQAAFCTRAGGR